MRVVFAKFPITDAVKHLHACYLCICMCVSVYNFWPISLQSFPWHEINLHSLKPVAVNMSTRTATTTKCIITITTTDTLRSLLHMFTTKH